MSTPRPGAAPGPFLEVVRPYSRLRAEAVRHELQKLGDGLDARAVFYAVTKARSVMSRAVRSANRAPGTDADACDVERRDPVADVADRLQRLWAGGTIRPVAHATRGQIGRPAEVQLTRDVLAYVAGPEEGWAEGLRQPEVTAVFVEIFTEGHAAQAAAHVARQGGDTDVLDVVYSRGLAEVTPTEAAEMVRDDEAEERIVGGGLHEIEDAPATNAVAHSGWALLSEVDLLRALHGRKEVLVAGNPKIGRQLNLVLAELLCLIGAERVGWGSAAWQDHDAPDPLRDCPEHPDPFEGAEARRGKQRWNRGMFQAMEAAIEAPQSGAVAAGPPVDGWIQELITVHRPKFAHLKAGKPRIVFAEQPAPGSDPSPEPWASQLLSTKPQMASNQNTTRVFRTHVQVCIDARLAHGG